MFAKSNLIRSGDKAQALVLDKKVGAIASQPGRGGLKAVATFGYLGDWADPGAALSCKYTLRVRFEDGSETEISRHAKGVSVCWVPVGELLPVRFDPEDRSQIEIDEPALKAQREAQAREATTDALARGEQALAESTGSKRDMDHVDQISAEGVEERRASGSDGVDPDLPPGQGLSASADRRARKQQARANKERQKARKAAQLEKLERQHEQGLLTDEELANKKARILGSN